MGDQFGNIIAARLGRRLIDNKICLILILFNLCIQSLFLFVKKFRSHNKSSFEHGRPNIFKRRINVIRTSRNSYYYDLVINKFHCLYAY